MTKKHEGLVGERKRKIAQFVLELTDRLYVAYGTDTGYLFGLPPNKRRMVEAIIDNAVVWTLSAVRDGRLDEELGVVGRDRLIGWGSGAEFEHNLEIELEVGDVVIALRKQGTGKEETKNADSAGQRD